MAWRARCYECGQEVRSLGRFTGNSPRSRTAILAWPSQLTGPTRASRQTLVRAPPSAKRSRGLLSRDPLLLAPSLVTSAATAYAPSGWVLWRHFIPADNPEANDARMWRAQPGTKTTAQCESEVKEYQAPDPDKLLDSTRDRADRTPSGCAVASTQRAPIQSNAIASTKIGIQLPRTCLAGRRLFEASSSIRQE